MQRGPERDGQGQFWSAKQGLPLPSGIAETGGHSYVTRWVSHFAPTPHAPVPRGCTCVASDSYQASPDIGRISWKQKVHNRIHSSPQLVCYPNPYQSVHALPSHFLKIHFNIILPSTTRSCFLIETLYASPFSPVRASPHLMLLITQFSPVSLSCHRAPSAPYPRTPSTHFPTLLWKTKFHTYINYTVSVKHNKLSSHLQVLQEFLKGLKMTR